MKCQHCASDMELIKLVEKRAIEDESDTLYTMLLAKAMLYNYPTDFRAHRKWLELAYKRGSADAALDIVSAIFREEPDYDKYGARIFELAKFAYDKGKAEAALILVVCYRNGVGTAEDILKAEEYENIARQHGYEM